MPLRCRQCSDRRAAWGYYPSAAFSASGDTATFMRRDKPDAGVEVHACKTCATTTHFELSEAFKAANPDADLVGVNMRLFAPEGLEGVEVRYPDGKNWDGAGAFDYRRPALTISAASPW